ncbi:hypothetical protein TOK_4630 [Pseudonocardia sp. N23]|nr:hypothetical protein TOK_4630 [Pseudonocardia sp. N23]
MHGLPIERVVRVPRSSGTTLGVMTRTRAGCASTPGGRPRTLTA